MDLEDLRVVHAIPGRVRLKVAQVRENPALAGELQKRLAATRGISKVEVNPLTSSVLVLYDERELSSPDVLHELAAPLSALFPGFDVKDFVKGQAPTRNGTQTLPPLTAGISSLFISLNTRISQVTGGSADLKILAPLLLFVLGARSLLVSEKPLVPTWYDFLWFALGTYFMLNPKPGEQQ
jgi:hypothetical protein